MEKSIKLKKIKRKRKHGFFERSKTHGGQKVLKNRRAKRKKSLTV
ncbi:MAG: 50S ribosomal protein L34 [Patescibacteria group bacterium]|nr:50S ribosomal protein L34 [Patescibacteria group bacterium]